MFHTKKSLGQNFLEDSQILNKIIETASLKSSDIVLEIGPGQGTLTTKILEKAKKVIAIEKDDRLINFLENKFNKEIKEGGLEIIHSDILKFDHEEYFKDSQYQIIANIPYYITGKFLKKFLSSNSQPTKMVLMLQKEVAQRIIGESKDPKKNKESILSISIKVYGIPKYIRTIPARYFEPQPKVDSAIILIEKISKRFFEEIDEESFFLLIKKAFSSKRKTLVNNLDYLPKNDLIKVFKKLNLSPKIRAENLSIEDWKNLYFELIPFPKN